MSDRSPSDSVNIDLGRGDPSEVAQARRLVRQFLAGSSEDVVAVAQLLTSELVTNALRHGGGDIRVSLDCADGVLRVRVRDGSARHPAVREHLAGRDADSGRGLLMVEKLATSWGSTPELGSGGKTVWFRLRTGWQVCAGGS